MKGAKSTRQPYANSERKNGKRSEKSTKLDRKSSRGMIYENEELRLRTININAEVERGQSDIKRLRRENEHLRREIWTLRDECDRLNKRFKAKLVDNTHDHGGCSARGSGASGGCSGKRGSCDRMHSNSNSDDSDSCDTCKGNNDDHCIDDYKYTPNDCCFDGSCKLPPFCVQQQDYLVNELATKFNNAQALQNLPGTVTTTADESNNSNSSEAQQLHSNFDHLSVVSEETMSNSEILSQTQQSDNLLGSQMTLPSLVGPITPLTPVELVANELNDLQAMVPPLSYFENVIQHHMVHGTSPESGSTTNSGKTVIHTNGWDYNLQSPFTQRKYPSHSSSSSSSAPRSPLSQTRYPSAQILTTFVSPNTLTPPTIVRTDVSEEEDQPVSSRSGVHSIETVAITTIPSSGIPVSSPKHFFAPLKPRLKINTSLANKSLLDAPVNLPLAMTPPPTKTADIIQSQNRDPPDIFVANALASPYQRPSLATTTATKTILPSTQHSPPALPLRQSPQVSPRQQRRYQHHNHHQQQQQHHHQHHHQHHKRHQHQLHVVTADIVLAKNDDVADVVDNASATAAATNTKSPQLQQAHIPHVQQQQEQQLQNSNPIYTKLNEPIYATAKKCCINLISAPAVTQPLMTTAIVATPPSHARKSSSCVSSITTSVGQKQTDSANLEAILNDIETISEDILAIQLEKNKSRDNVSVTVTKTPENSSTSATIQAQKRLQQNDKNKKPYRSEMNLMIAYDGTNPTITPTTSAAANVTQPTTSIVTNDNNNTTRRTRSLEREHTESPSPNVPDPMTPFPPNRTYIGFDQLNAAAGNRKPPLPPSQVTAQVPTSGGSMAKIGSAGSKPGTPIKVLPPVPPVRMHPPPLNLCSADSAQLPQQCNTEQMVDQTTKGSSIVGLAPNKSHLFAALANAAVAKRAQFLATPTHLSRSLDTDGLTTVPSEQESLSAEAAKKKARRVSIVCGDSNNEGGKATSEEAIATSLKTTAAISTTPQGSCTDLKATNPIVMHLRQTSHSTPNSPHSMRRGSNELSVGTPHHHNFTSGVQSQTQVPLQPGGLALGQHRKSSQDSTNCITAAAAELAAAAAVVAARSKCSRRHSDGTVVAGVQRTSGTSNHQHHHHNHHRHHHQHSSSVVSNNPHHSHHSHPESNHDSAESISDRNSSVASSRDSSTSFSMRSQRRKISVSSHTGGKIPWCGCWGNGCL